MNLNPTFNHREFMNQAGGPDGLSATLNSLLELPTPTEATRANGYTPGLGCRWDRFSNAWFTVLPLEAEELAQRIGQLFREGGCREVRVAREAGGEKLQVSAYI